MAGFSIEVRDEEVRKRLQGLVLAARNLRPAFTEIGGMLVTSTQTRFEQQRDPDGRAWKPLASVTLLGRVGKSGRKKDGSLNARGRRRMAEAQILLNSARLYQSITFAADSRSVAVGTNVVYARIHQLGGQTGRGLSVTIPPRPYLGFNGADQAGALSILNRHFGGMS